MNESTDEPELQSNTSNVEPLQSTEIGETSFNIPLSEEAETIITETTETITTILSEPLISTEAAPIDSYSETTTTTTTTLVTEQLEETYTPLEQKNLESIEAVVVASSSKAPANPKSHPALPRPPGASTQRPVFHIIAPRATAPETTPRTYRPRQYVSKASADPRSNIVRTYEPRRYIRIDKPPMAVPRQRKTAPSVINILQSASTSKIPIRASHKPINIHQLSSGPSISKPPKPATSAPPPTGPTVALLKPPKSVTPQPTISEKIGRGGQRKTKQASSMERSSEEPEQKRKRSIVDVESVNESEEGETTSESDPNRSARQRDALDYLDEVKHRFDPATYNTFLDVMKGFKMKNMNTIGVIRRVCYLFASEPSLIAGFNNFLPQGFDIQLHGKLVTIRDPEGNTHSVNILENPGLSDHHGPSSSDVSQQQQAPPPSQPLQIASEESTRPFENAVIFLQVLKTRVSTEKYEQFLEIIKGSEGRLSEDPEYSKLMFQKVAQVLESDEDLLLGFSSFLPEMQQWCLHEFQRRQIYEASITNKDFYHDLELKFRENSSEEKFSSEPAETPAGKDDNEDENDNVELTNYIPLRTKPIKNLLQIVKCSMTEDYAFFNKVREALDDDKIFDNFARVLRLYTNGLITREQLFSTTMPFFRGLPLLQREFKRIMGYNDGYIHPPVSNHEIVGDGSVDLDMKSELDFTTLKCNGRSYRLLPEKYRHPKCSGRTRLCKEVLNDDFAIFPSWSSEETRVVSIKKSSFEEFLHRTEDERFEIDILIQVNTEALTALERIRRLASMDPRYEVGENYECGSKTFMIRAVRRAYGENAGRVLEALKKNPLLVANTVLNRLKIKQREWKNMENAFKLVWEDQARKYYQKMTDNRITHMKKLDNKIMKGNIMFSAFQKLFKRRQVQSLLGELDKYQKIHAGNLFFSFPIDWRIAYDLSDLLITFIRRQQSIERDEKQSMRQFVYKVIPMFFDLPPNACENEDGIESSDGNLKFKFDHPKKPSIQPRKFYAGDDFLHFIYLYQTVILRLNKIFVRAQEYFKEEEYKFEVLKMRQKAFKEAKTKLPEWCDSQWDVIDGWDAIIPEKRRSHDRYMTYVSDLNSLLEGKMTSNTFDEAIKSLFEADAYPVLNLDKFIATMARLIQVMIQNGNMLNLINKYWALNYLTEDMNHKQIMNECIQEIPKLFENENMYLMEIYDDKETIVSVKMLQFETPFEKHEEKFKSAEWKVFRAAYRRELNVVQRKKKRRSRFKSLPMFLLRNLKLGWDRLGRYKHDEGDSSSSSDDGSSDEDEKSASCNDGDSSDYEEDCDFVPYTGQPILGVSLFDVEDDDSDIAEEMEIGGKPMTEGEDIEEDESDTNEESKAPIYVCERGCQTYEEEFDSSEESEINFEGQISEKEKEKIRKQIEEEGKVEEETEEPELSESLEEEREEDNDKVKLKKKQKRLSKVNEEVNKEEKKEKEKTRHLKNKPKKITQKESSCSDEDESSTQSISSSSDESPPKKITRKQSRRSTSKDTKIQKTAVSKSLKESISKEPTRKQSASRVSSSIDPKTPKHTGTKASSSVAQEPLMLPSGSSRVSKTPLRSSEIKTASSGGIISTDECRRRINKFTAHQSYKMLKAEFRSARIPPISESEHDYDDPKINELGQSHLGGTNEDRKWWTTNLKLKKIKKSKGKSKSKPQAESSSSDEDEEDEEEEEDEEYCRPQKKLGRPPIVRKQKKKPGPKKGWKKQQLHESSQSRKKSTSMESEKKEASSDEREHSIEVRLPAPPKRYSSDDEEGEAVETARGDTKDYGRESPELCREGEDIKLLEDDEIEIARGKEKSPNPPSQTPKIDASTEALQETKSDFVRTTRSRSRSISIKPLQIPSTTNVSKPRVSFSDETKVQTKKAVDKEKDSSSSSDASSSSNSSSNEEEHPSTSVVKNSSSNPSSSEVEIDQNHKESITQQKTAFNLSLLEQIESTTSKSISPQEAKSKSIKTTDVEIEETKSSSDDEEKAEDEEEIEDEEEEPEDALNKETKRRAKEVYLQKKKDREEKEKNRPKIGIWMSTDLAEACESNFCRHLIVVENKTAPNVMYRFNNIAKNNEKYREIKKHKFDIFIEKRLQGKRPKRRKTTSELSEMDDPQAFIERNMGGAGSHEKQEIKKGTSKEKSKSRQPLQSDNDE